jgi:DNA-binding PadR family transcriptional regulator
MKYLSRADEILLLAIWRLKDEAYGVSILREVEKRSGKRLSFGGLWVSLDILHRKGLVRKRMADPSEKRGGRRKLFYKLTPRGILALQEVRDLNRSLWRGLPARLAGPSE